MNVTSFSFVSFELDINKIKKKANTISINRNIYFDLLVTGEKEKIGLFGLQVMFPASHELVAD